MGISASDEVYSRPIYSTPNSIEHCSASSHEPTSRLVDNKEAWDTAEAQQSCELTEARGTDIGRDRES